MYVARCGSMHGGDPHLFLVKLNSRFKGILTIIPAVIRPVRILMTSPQKTKLFLFVVWAAEPLAPSKFAVESEKHIWPPPTPELCQQVVFVPLSFSASVSLCDRSKQTRGHSEGSFES